MRMTRVTQWDPPSRSSTCLRASAAMAISAGVPGNPGATRHCGLDITKGV